MSLSRPWLALVLALCCLPLFIGLGREDVRDDEAIYSFAVERILETGDWLEPKSIPNETWAFLEKPPLKFWIVAAPIRFGLLPHNEFGIRFWDALFGALSFIYVFLIGSRLLSGFCGAVAVLVLFGHDPLLFVHGLRSNNMEAPLVLAYCGGMYHFLAWAASDRKTARSAHAFAAGLFFVLGFMTKFVAVAFLPMVLATATIVVPAYRRQFRRDWLLWAGVGAVCLALVAPWFLWAWRQYGNFFWETILREAVFTRFTAYLDPTHVQPWYFYLTTLYSRFSTYGSALLVLAGLVLLIVQTVRRRWPEGLVILLWCAVPLLLISMGTSKLYHYVYPFLPPFALAAGYAAGLASMLAAAPFSRIVQSLQEHAGARWPGAVAATRRPAVRALLLAVAATAVGIAIITLARGPIRITIGANEVFKSSGVFRPLLIAVVFGLAAGAGRMGTKVIVAVLVMSALPLPAYRQSLGRLDAAKHPMRTARDCIAHVQAQTAGLPRGLYVDAPPHALPYPHYYYFRTIQPWTRSESPSPAGLQRYLYDPEELRPILVWEPTYQDFWHRPDTAEKLARDHTRSPSMIVFEDIANNLFLLLPGPYAACSPESAG
jgi:4-amino-4-deoxy-L-arabinose transferase-like glycosyltransferase